MNFTYTGPSWAASSYPIEDATATNLAKLWNIPYLDQSRPGSSVLPCVKMIKKEKSSAPIVWIYNEPLGDLVEITSIGYKEFLARPDWKDIRKECNQYCLTAISSLNRPVLLIGAHSDIVDCNHANITVGHHSWQKFLADQADMITRKGKINVKMDDGGSFSFRNCWGAEVIHRKMHSWPDISPDSELVNNIWDIFFFWKALEKADLFYEVHPNRRGNMLFAEHLKPTVIKFLEDNT
jgi:hypothetical protein